jgi:lactate 2-monooxygenase
MAVPALVARMLPTSQHSTDTDSSQGCCKMLRGGKSPPIGANMVLIVWRDIEVELFGIKLSSPIICAPIGVQKIMHEDAEEATAKACRNIGVPMILSTAATRTIEEVAKANGDGLRWYQLYWPKPQDEEITLSLLKRAKDNGYKVLVVTLDTFNLAYRPTDVSK